ncbi:peptidoglycan recognition protein [Streptomyces kunmingensis]|uniref:Peptidoglycan recognition protein n=1 Tax=Streptomyces kunmingensis TaxID=68225 RepID=A0ABU6C9C0_9ACTN|nr:peptidoglycan recognition protein [Streptomyces kunmingensis]MEB3961313.1 peptidoglycan recognition protein [Streptomyces kunmingensis]
MRRVWCCVPGALVLGLLVLAAVLIDRSAPSDAGPGAGTAARAAARVHTAAQPRIVRREQWLAGMDTYERDPVRYADRVVAVFIHHTDSPNGYDCADSPRIIRYIYAGQAGSKEWDDIGYNFLVDRCGTVFEGRAGGVGRAVVGAHTQGFNGKTAGIAAIGTFGKGVQVPRAMADSIAALAAWKLGLSGVDPRSTVRLKSTNSLSRFEKGTSADFRAISGHRDGYETYCPGEALMAELPAIRARAARLQNRP